MCPEANDSTSLALSLLTCKMGIIAQTSWGFQDPVAGQYAGEHPPAPTQTPSLLSPPGRSQLRFSWEAGCWWPSMQFSSCPGSWPPESCAQGGAVAKCGGCRQLQVNPLSHSKQSRHVVEWTMNERGKPVSRFWPPGSNLRDKP